MLDGNIVHGELRARLRSLRRTPMPEVNSAESERPIAFQALLLSETLHEALLPDSDHKLRRHSWISESFELRIAGPHFKDPPVAETGARTLAGIKNVDRIEFQNFSDLVVRYTPIDTPANVQSPSGLLFSELLSLAYAQSSLVSDGIILRGAVTVGQIRKSRGVIYGPGLGRRPTVSRKALRIHESCCIRTS